MSRPRHQRRGNDTMKRDRERAPMQRLVFAEWNDDGQARGHIRTIAQLRGARANIRGSPAAASRGKIAGEAEAMTGYATEPRSDRRDGSRFHQVEAPR
jgi:hypothetical protein